MSPVKLLLPTHLFPLKHTEKEVYIALDPVLFTGPDGTFKVHKAKLVYLITVAEEFAKRRRNVVVVYPDDVDALYASLNSKQVVAYPPLDRYIEAKYDKHLPRVKYLKHPGFVVDSSQYYGSLKLTPVYNHARRVTGIMPGVPSMDKDNRHPPDRILTNKAPSSRKSVSFAMKKAIEHVEKHYGDHYGDAHGAGFYPTTRRAALNRLERYVESGLSLVRYQDAIVKGEPFLAHSVLSAAMNVGIIGPVEVCTAALNSKHSISDKEGFVRQVLGWRELMRVYYEKGDHTAFGIYNPPNHRWYQGNTGLSPVDDVVMSCLKTAYAHHINRLMVCLNAFTLTNHDRSSIYRWFMEIVAIDAYDWVMVANISIMGPFGTGVSHKPYVSSSTYIERLTKTIGKTLGTRCSTTLYAQKGGNISDGSWKERNSNTTKNFGGCSRGPH